MLSKNPSKALRSSIEVVEDMGGTDELEVLGLIAGVVEEFDIPGCVLVLLLALVV